jgi:hypothetical protein
MSITMTINAASCGPRDWDALTAFIAAMRGEAAAPATGGTLAILAAAPPPPVLASEALLASAAAAVTVAPPPPPPPAGVEVDVAGLPWDARIHASSKTKNADGSWRAKRGVDDAIVATLTAELKSVMAAPPAPIDPAAAFGAPPAPLSPPLAVTSLGPGAAIAAPPSIVVVPDAPLAPPAGVATASPAAVASPAVSEFAELVKLVTSRQTAGTLTTDIVMTISQQLGLTSLTDFANRPDLIPAFKAMLP